MDKFHFAVLVLVPSLALAQDNPNLNLCYEMTWISRPLNETYPCVDPENYPCNEEKYEVSDEPPTDEYLEDGAAEKGWNCTKSVGESCVKYTYFTRTEEPRAFNITRLCAKGIESPHGTEVDSGCYEQELQGYTLEACFCQDFYCNAGNRPEVRHGLPTSLLTYLFAFKLVLSTS